MFRETLLESAPVGHKRKRWPMAAAVTLETLVVGVLIALPLLSSGILPVSARTSGVVHLDRPQPIRENHDRGGPAGGGGHGASEQHVVTVVTPERSLCFTNCQSETETDCEPASFNVGLDRMPNIGCETCRDAEPRLQRIQVSDLSAGALTYRVEPVYPRMAVVTRTHGVVRLHAIISVDGTIQSLNVIDGPPLLVEAARDAVRQWRYRPYVLNGRPVEVETLITVNFKGLE